MKTIKLLTALCFTLAFVNANAQDSNSDIHTIGITIPAVALVDIEPAASKNVTMNFTAPIEAGLPLTAAANNDDLWLNYSFIPSASGIEATVAVKLDILIPGLDINVTVAPHAGGGDGTMGTTAGTLTLTTSDQDIITTIGACYTGDGNTNGHNLTYALDVNGGTSNYANLFAAVNSVTVTYTISE